MSFYKFRNGRSLFRSRNLKGYLKILFNRKKENDTLVNKMSAKYQVNND